MNVLIAALELAPYVQTTPAAESVASLAKALKLLGHDVTIAAPRVSAYEEAGLMAARQLSPLSLDGGGEATLHDAQLPSGITLTLVDVEGQPFSHESSAEKQPGAVGAFASAVAALASRQAQAGTPFDVVHAHDAAAGLSLMKLARGTGKESVVGRVLTVHDADRSGQFPTSAVKSLGIPEERAGAQGFASGDGLCLLKGLVAEADAIVVPSDTYGRQMKAPEKYGALSRAFQAVNLSGVGEGVDYAIYNPSTDSALVSRYDAPNPENKGRNKVDVLGELGLDFEPARPVLFCEDLPHGESALDTVLAALPALIRNDVTLIVSADETRKEANRELLEPFAEQVAWITDLEAAKRRRILAAADFYLSVARRDPSGQCLLQAARYGAVPIALRVDAVTDVVVDADAELKTGTGIVFESMTQRALVGAVARAISAYRSPEFRSLLSRVMRQDLGWDRAARRHIQIYRSAASAHA